jgi:uncharacterized protein DUF4388/FHA domain-containing protein
MEKILEGDLSRFEVPDLLTFLNMGRRTGVLILERPEQESKLFFREGNPVYSTSTRDSLRLGNMLVRLGRVRPDQLQRVLGRLGPGFRIGQALLVEKVLSEEELASFLKVQVSEVIFDTFEWRSGIFTFYDKIPPPATAVTLDMDLQNLIMEGVRRIDERGRLAEFFPDLNMIVESVANTERVKATVTLTKEEWQVYFLIDGRRSLAEVCRLAGNPDELATLQILHHLAVAKFVRLVTPLPETAEGSARPSGGEPVLVGTVLRQGPEPPAGPVQVAFSPGSVSRKIGDDTKDIVSPQAVQYLDSSSKITVSRLVLLKDGQETSFPLTRDTYTLGRHRNNDIVISDAKVSSFHARIDRAEQGFAIVDLKSRNGSYVNGKRIQTASLKTGDELRLGTARLVYRVDYTSS